MVSKQIWLPLLRTEEISLAIVKHDCCNTRYILASILRTLKPPVLRGRLELDERV